MSQHSVRGPQLGLSAVAGDNARRTSSQRQAIRSAKPEIRFYFTAVHVDSLDLISGRFREIGRLSLAMAAQSLRDRIAFALDGDGAAVVAPDYFSFSDIGRLMSWTAYGRDVSAELAAELRDTARVIWEGLSGMKGGFPFTRVESRPLAKGDSVRDSRGNVGVVVGVGQMGVNVECDGAVVRHYEFASELTRVEGR